MSNNNNAFHVDPGSRTITLLSLDGITDRLEYCYQIFGHKMNTFLNIDAPDIDGRCAWIETDPECKEQFSIGEQRFTGCVVLIPTSPMDSDIIFDTSNGDYEVSINGIVTLNGVECLRRQDLHIGQYDTSLDDVLNQVTLDDGWAILDHTITDDLRDVCDPIELERDEILQMLIHLRQHGDLVVKAALEKEPNLDYLGDYLSSYSVYADPNVFVNRRALIIDYCGMLEVDNPYDTFIIVDEDATFKAIAQHHFEVSETIDSKVIAWWDSQR